MTENRCPLIENCQQKSAVCNVQLPDETCYWFRWFRALDNPWHTGTPTEDGYYLIHLRKYYCKDTVGYMVAKWERNWWRTINVGSYWNLDEEIDAWQKIEPYKEREDG